MPVWWLECCVFGGMEGILGTLVPVNCHLFPSVLGELIGN